jgi:hypothetical protein
MHQVPARIEKQPRTSSHVPRKPAVPPAPVAGAALAIACDVRLRRAVGRAVALRLADGRAVALRLAVGRAVALRVAEGWELSLGLAEGLLLVLSVSAGLGELVDDTGEVAPGDKLGSVACGEDVQPATAADASKAARPAVISLPLNLVIVKCLL